MKACWWINIYRRFGGFAAPCVGWYLIPKELCAIRHGALIPEVLHVSQYCFKDYAPRMSTFGCLWANFCASVLKNICLTLAIQNNNGEKWTICIMPGHLVFSPLHKDKNVRFLSRNAVRMITFFLCVLHRNFLKQLIGIYKTFYD
jgi:hypothetical protein